MTQEEALRKMHELAESLHGEWNREIVEQIFDLAYEHEIFAAHDPDEGKLAIEDDLYDCHE